MTEPLSGLDHFKQIVSSLFQRCRNWVNEIFHREKVRYMPLSKEEVERKLEEQEKFRESLEDLQSTCKTIVSQAGQIPESFVQLGKTLRINVKQVLKRIECFKGHVWTVNPDEAENLRPILEKAVGLDDTERLKGHVWTVNPDEAENLRPILEKALVPDNVEEFFQQISGGAEENLDRLEPQAFMIDDAILAYEQAKQIHTRDLALQMLVKKKENLEIQRNELPKVSILNREDAKRLNQQLHDLSLQIEFCTKKIEEVKKHEKDWVSTLDVHELGGRKQMQITNGFEHQILGGEDQEVKESFLSLGVICDHTNEFTNLQELKENPKACMAKAEQLKKVHSKYKDEQLGTLDRVIAELENPHKTAIFRETVLEVQMLQYLQTMVAGQKEIGKDLFIVHNSLLRANIGRNKDLSKSIKGFDDVGWLHSEENEMREMGYMFDQWNGKTIVFEKQGSAAYVKDNEIHLPAPQGIKPGTQCDLTMAFVNVSVQFHDNEAVKMQQELSANGFEKIKSFCEGNPQDDNPRWKRGKEMFDECLKRYNKRKSSYELADTLNASFLLMGIPFSTGCMGNKDRTSVVASRACARVLLEEHILKQEREGESVDRSKITNKFRPLFWSCFVEGSIARQIAWLNAEQKFIKAKIYPDRKYPTSINIVAQNSLKSGIGVVRRKPKVKEKKDAKAAG